MTIIQVLRREGPSTVVDLLHHTRLSYRGLVEEVDRLIAKGWIEIVYRPNKPLVLRVKD